MHRYIVRRGVSSASSKGRVRVSPRVTRVEGDFPPLVDRSSGTFRPANQQIVDIDSPDADQVRDLRVRTMKPHEMAKREAGKTRASEVSRDSPAEAEPDIPQWTDKDIPEADTEAMLKMKKFRWMPNPFLVGTDSRQGGPLYYSKYFSDRNREKDDPLLHEEAKRQAEKLAKEEEQPEEKKRRKKRDIYVKKYKRPKVEKLEAMHPLSLERTVANEAYAVKTGKMDKDDDTWDMYYTLLVKHAQEGKLKALPIARYLDSFAKVRHCSPRHLSTIVGVLIPLIPDSKPAHLVFIFDALASMFYRDQRLSHFMEYMSPSWAGLRPYRLLVEGVNAVACLDLASSQWAQSLAVALADSLPNLTAVQLNDLRYVAVFELLDDHGIMDYLCLCHSHSDRMVYRRRLHMVELYARLAKPDTVWAKLPTEVKAWLEQLRHTTESVPSSRTKTNSLYTNDMHKDVSQVVGMMGLDQVCRQRCGPFQLDIFLPESNTVVEACGEFQFFVRTAQFTPEARWRHELIRLMGFKLVPIPYHSWMCLQSDEAKVQYLRETLPRECFKSRHSGNAASSKYSPS